LEFYFPPHNLAPTYLDDSRHVLTQIANEIIVGLLDVICPEVKIDQCLLSAANLVKHE
jgi:hypothetical protein